MARLFRVESSGELIKAEEKPFTDETDEMEPFVKKNVQILGDVLIFGEQTVSSKRDKRTDLLAVNIDGEILVIELKKDPVGKEILPQVLGYKLYWKKHPDSVKTLWADYEDISEPQGIEPDWDNYDPKILVVAPSFDDELVEIAAEENLSIRFVEMSRYQHANSTFVVVNELEPVRSTEGPITTQREYGWDWYARNFSEKQIKIAKHLDNEILGLFENRSWSIAPKFNMWYLVYKYGHHNAVWLEFRHKGKVAIGVNLRDEKTDPSSKSKVNWQWDKSWRYWYTEVASDDFDVSQVEPVLELAYQNTVRP